VLNRTFGETAGYDDFVLIRDIDVTSQCRTPHDAVHGKAHIAYTRRAGGGIVEVGAPHRHLRTPLQTQEHLTAQIAAANRRKFSTPRRCSGDRAEHTCMSVRGVAKHGAMTFTSRFTDVPRQSGGTGAFSCPWCEGRSASPRFESRGCPVSTSAEITTSRKGWHSSPGLTRQAS